MAATKDETLKQDAGRWALGLSLVAVALALAPARAHAETSARGKHVTVTLIPEVEAIEPGTPFWVGLRLEMDRHWHTYWKNPGDSGLATRIDWRLPDGFTAGPIEWPYPERMPLGPLMSYGYEGEVLLLTEISPPATLRAGQEASLAAKVSWLECKEACLPGKAELSLRLPVRAGAPQTAARWAPLFAEARRRLPVAAPGWQMEALASAGALALSLRPSPGSAPPSDETYFYAEQGEVIDYAAPQRLMRTDADYRLELVPATNAAQPFCGLKGVLVTGQGDATIALRVDVPARCDSSLTPIRHELSDRGNRGGLEK